MTNEPDLVDGAFALRVDLRAYRLNAVKKTAYRFAGRCHAALGSVHDDHVAVRLSFTDGTTEDAARSVLRSFFRELLDQELREEIAHETSALRTLILAQAFSKTDLIRRE